MQIRHYKEFQSGNEKLKNKLVEWKAFIDTLYGFLRCCTIQKSLFRALQHSALSMETKLKQKLTSNLIFYRSAPNPSGKMMSMYLPAIWEFTWYDSMSRDCHMTNLFLQKAVSFVDSDMFQILLRLGWRSYSGFSSHVATEKSCTFELC